MENLLPVLVPEIRSGLPPSLLKFCKDYDVVVAGGWAIHQWLTHHERDALWTPKDIDVVCPVDFDGGAKNRLIAVQSAVLKEHYPPVNVFSATGPIERVSAEYFDLTICQVWFDGDDHFWAQNQEVIDDLRMRRMRFNPECLQTAFDAYRVVTYAMRGFNMSEDDFRMRIEKPDILPRSK